jgi:hypothetical protein
LGLVELAAATGDDAQTDRRYRLRASATGLLGESQRLVQVGARSLEITELGPVHGGLCEQCCDPLPFVTTPMIGPLLPGAPPIIGPLRPDRGDALTSAA